MAIKYSRWQLVAVFSSYLKAVPGKTDDTLQPNKKSMDRYIDVGKSGYGSEKIIRIDVCAGDLDQDDKSL
jgi:hypothetical protein